jgi:hypothetical protein
VLGNALQITDASERSSRLHAYLVGFFFRFEHLISGVKFSQLRHCGSRKIFPLAGFLPAFGFSYIVILGHAF